jgi:serine/threonine protein kinase/Tol biopolymer transport system component
LIGSTVSHYRILDRLGGGGMGVVYKAVDLKLDRPVALKFLSSQRGAAEEHKRRFLREARAASALDHPNICTVYEIDETPDGALFIAMALCEGETLRDRIARGPLPVEEAVAIAEQMAAGLARAHGRGIVHRDVKPANVIVAPDGRVKLVDFGIAKLSDQSRLTRAGTTVGTAGYMSPEQLHGEAADPRTDVWSLGVVIYEMLAGHTPFEAESETAMVKAILKRPPRPLSEARPEVPPVLARIVERALEKRLEDRTPGMDAMSAELRRLAASLGGPWGSSDPDRTVIGLPAPPQLPPPLPSGGAPEGLHGQVIGHYEILEILGGGGMGVVYKARDLRLARIVALKFLPPELTRDREAKLRFEQEARAASSLDHPNLCTILELGEAPDGRLYLAMPCYDGETLRRRIELGPFAVEEAVDIALQIARGLSKAHRNGIIHRDVKPANLIVTSDGVVKILDFGLAKLAGSAAIPHAGSSAGTPAYMSPEQARGDEVDPRTDLWSLGVILYEMLAGRRPFRGEREQAVVRSILHERAQPLRELRPEAPPELAGIVERLLAKAPGDRYPTVEEAIADLRALQGGATATTWIVGAPPPRRTGPWVWGTAAAGAGAVLIAAAFLWRPGRPATAAPAQVTFTRLTDQEGRETFPSVAPNGSEFVYARETSPGNLDLYSQRIGGSNPRNLTADSPVDDTQPAFSPDGSAIAFRSEREGGGVFLMGATGESVRRLTDFGFNPTWSPDGQEILVATEGVSDPRVRKTTRSEIWRVDVATGARRRLAAGDAVQPSWSPHGRRVAYWGLAGGSARALWTISAAGGPPALVLRDGFLNWSPVWSPDGKHLYFASNRGGSMNLWRMPIDEVSGRPAGAPEAITAPSEWSGLPSLSLDGKRILYATGESRTSLARSSLDPVDLAAGRLEAVTQGSRGIRSCDVSPDGRWVAFHASIPQEDLFVIQSDGAGLRQLTDDPFRDRYPRWSPDGSRLFFQSDRAGAYGIWSLRADGSGLEPVTPEKGAAAAYPVPSPDGRWLASILPGKGGALLDLSLPRERRRPVPFPPVDGAGNLFDAVAWSPDGRQLAGVVDGPGSGPGVVLYSLVSGSYTRLTDRGEVPVWMPGGKTLLIQEEGRLLAVDVRTRSLREILSLPPGSTAVSHCLSPDGRTLFVSQASEDGDIGMLTLR